MKTKISLVRHGLVENPGEVYYGRLPGFGLAQLGQAQAAAAGDYLSEDAVDVIYHSPMLRAFQTAEIIQSRCGPTTPLVECDLLNEIHSAYDGQSVAEMERRDWNFYLEVSPPYEQPEDVLARIVAFFDLVREKHPGRHVVGVSHADPISFAVMWANSLPVSAEQRKQLVVCGVPDGYPAPASISTFSFANTGERELLEFCYHAPPVPGTGQHEA
ncbi:MAG: histidine phosphatase family protein [Candidatus Promineofilum sp.]|nr:histidine phosphatase family protein [Promineifilum sp.]